MLRETIQRLKCLWRLSGVLSRLRLETHIDELGLIHDLVLSSRFNQRNLDNVLLHRGGKELADFSSQRDLLRAVEMKIFSQNGEDGILSFLVSRIKNPVRAAMDIGCGGKSSNTLNLICNREWTGVFVDMSDKALNETKRNAAVGKVKSPCHYLNLNICDDGSQKKVKEALDGNEIGVLSIDIDGLDYWIWKEVQLDAQIVVIEFNPSFGPEKSLTVKNDPTFNINEAHPKRWFHGASLEAMRRLGLQKGYGFVGVDSNGVNAFFMRQDLLSASGLQEVSSEEAYYPHFQRPEPIEEQVEATSQMGALEVGEDGEVAVSAES